MPRLSDQQWPADAVERRPVADLVPYARNSRTHTDQQVDQIAASMREWGVTTPILVDEAGTIIAGHARVLAAKKLGLPEIPVMVARGWTDAQRQAYVIADNKLAMNAGWDDALLKVEIEALDVMGFDLGLTGFSDDELKALLAGATADDATTGDETAELPAPPDDPVSQPGDVWILGRHRVMCGDSTNPEHIARLMAGKTADFCFTSPPYAQQRDYKSGGISDWDALMQGVFSVLPVNEDAQVLVNLGLVHKDSEWVPYWERWIEWMRGAGWRRFGWYVWDQGPGLPGDWNGRLAPSHEFIFHFNRVPEKPRKTKDAKHAGQTLGGGGLRTADGTIKAKTGSGNAIQDKKIPDSVVRVMRHKGAVQGGSHPAVFPVDLVSEMLTAYTDPDDLVFEPFCGSGTQVISAQKNGRSCYAMELAPAYADVAVRRWQLFTKQLAKLDGDGRSFDEVSADRKGDKDAA